MKKLNKLAAGLYPSSWRERYGAEFDALLDDARPGLGGTFDIIKGALAMRLSRSNLLLIPVALGAAGLLIALGVSFEMKDRYESVTTLELKIPAGSDSQGTNQATNEELVKLMNTTLSRETLISVIRSHDLYHHDFQSKPPEDIVEAMRRSIVIAPLAKGKNNTAFMMRFQYEDPRMAQSVVQGLVAKTMDTWITVSAESAKDSQTGSGVLNLLDPPSRPTRAISPNHLSVSLAGLTGGIFIGGLLAIVLRIFKRRNPNNPPSTLA